MIVHAPISVGELFDKITILKIKCERIMCAEKLLNIRAELEQLEGLATSLRLERFDSLDELATALRSVNGELWDIEDAKRECERRKDFGETFIRLARDVYIKNDKRALLKKLINEQCGSTIVEEKSYSSY